MEELVQEENGVADMKIWTNMEGRRECEKDNNTYVKYFDTNRDERGMKRKKKNM